MIEVMAGDNLELLRTLPDDSVSSIVCDPPYGLKFMGRKWDYEVPGVETWAECLRVLKPGGYLVAFAGTRTQHRMAVNIEDAGFEIRDLLAWIYGSGYPKSMDIAKQFDKEDGNWRGRAGAAVVDNTCMNSPNYERNDKGEPISEEAKKWAGWGTALKPAMEPITLARKPLEGKYSENIRAHGVGPIHIDACRVPVADGEEIHARSSPSQSLGGTSPGWDRPWKSDPEAVAARLERADVAIEKANTLGRWPANIMHDGSPEVLDLFPVTKSQRRTLKRAGKHNTGIYGDFKGQENVEAGHTDAGSAARLFWCSKASKKERGADYNNHPTVKPVEVMAYLCRLVTPPGGIILDPWGGSGTTGVAAFLEGFDCIVMEREQEFVEIIYKRLIEAGAFA